MTRLFAKLVWVEAKLLAREPILLVFTFVFPIVVMVVLFGVFGSQPTTEFRFARPIDYYQASYLAVVIAALGLVALPVHVATYREQGVLRRFRASSVPASGVLGAQLVVTLGLASIGGVTLVVVGAVVYDANAPVSTLGVVAGFALSALSFLALGFLIGSLARTARAAQAIGMLLFFPMWLLSGAGPPPEVLSDGMRQASDLLPLTYAVLAIQDPWLGHPTSTSTVVVLAAMLVIASVGAVRVTRTV
ncbi:MAG: ABC transporter permease [Acidimicrobiales bacterium]